MTISFNSTRNHFPLKLGWQGDESQLAGSIPDIRNALLDLNQTTWVVLTQDGIKFASSGQAAFRTDDHMPEVLAMVNALPLGDLGDEGFRRAYGLQYACYGGAMANGISSEEMVIALGKAGMMGSYGAGGMSPQRVEEAIHKIQAALPDQPYAFNLLSNPFEPAIEQRTAELYVQHGVCVVEASAYLIPSKSLVYYRAAGLSALPDGGVKIGNKVIAKLSRKEVARKFMAPAPEETLRKLVNEGLITEEQANLAARVPLADDITVEADSGGHTDNRPLVSLIPSMLGLRDEIQSQRQYPHEIRIGAAGGIATPEATWAAFQMGAAYVVTGSINQACVEAGASEHTRKLLAQVEMTDVAMAPAGDMFEMGARVQVLKRGTMFSMRAQKLYELYTRYEAWEQIPETERQKLESSVFQRTFDDIWADCVTFFSQRDPKVLERAEKNPRDRMALVFRWYLGLSSRWSAQGVQGREMDYQIWCGPAMGAFNDWTRGTYLEQMENRHVADAALQILTGAAYLARVRTLEAQGINMPAELRRYRPEAL